MISIIDYGMGNIGSMQNMIRKVGGLSRVITTPDEVFSSEKLILPGVGSFDSAVHRLTKSGIWAALNHVVMEAKIKILCVCLGAQLATVSSEEGLETGFCWIKAHTKRFPATKTFKVPHMGWNDVVFLKKDPLIRNLPDISSFYFVHSFYMQADNSSDVLAVASHGIEFHAALKMDNVYALQFHPEKSHKFGMTIMKNFWEL